MLGRVEKGSKLDRDERVARKLAREQKGIEARNQRPRGPT